MMTDFVQSLPALRKLVIVIDDVFGRDPNVEPGSYEPPQAPMPIRLVEGELPDQWSAVCVDLMEVGFVRSWGWRRLGPGFEWVRAPTLDMSFAF